MNDYSELINSKDDFILNYQINNDKIIIYYRNNYEVKPYTKNLEKEILSQMENQAKKALQLKTSFITRLNNDINVCLVMFLLTIIHTIIFITNAASLITYISSSLVILSFFIGLKDIVNEKNKIKELEKIEYYFKNQLKLNNITKISNIKLSKKAKKHLENKNIAFNINCIDNFSLTDLKKIKEYIDKEYEKTEETKQKIKILK